MVEGMQKRAWSIHVYSLLPSRSLVEFAGNSEIRHADAHPEMIQKEGRRESQSESVGIQN